jgi:hypothetical protein
MISNKKKILKLFALLKNEKRPFSKKCCFNRFIEKKEFLKKYDILNKKLQV